MTKPTLRERIIKVAEFDKEQHIKLMSDGYGWNSSTFEGARTQHARTSALLHKLSEAVEAHEYSMRQWEAVDPDGHMHLVAWQRSRNIVREIEAEVERLEEVK